MLLAFGLAACASHPPQETPSPPPTAPAESEPSIDYIGLQHTLNMDRSPEDLGFKEKRFNTCKAGNGYSHSDDCHTEHFVVIHFQLMCRETDESAMQAVSNDDIHPISNQTLDWLLLKHRGQIQTDDYGYGQIRMAFPASARTQRLKINLGRQFLFMRAGEITRVVTPKNWCAQRG